MSVERIEHAAIEEQAGVWLARRDSGKWSARDDEEFDAWINQSIAHSVAYWRLQDAWETTSKLKALGAGVRSEDPPPRGEWNLSPFFTQRREIIEPERRHARLRFRALAAGLGAAAIAVAAWFGISSVNSFDTPIGAVASLPMEDGSKITLNTDSKIKVTLSETERRIELKQGEAFFEVAKDPSRPFVVNVGYKRVIALGTSFSVRKGSDNAADDIKVVVTDGAVRIETTEDSSVPESSEQRLNAGDIASIAGEKVVVQRQKLHEAEESLSWRSGVLVFRDISLAHAAAEFNRYNKRKILIEDPEVAALTIAGSFRSTNVESFVEVIEKGYPVRVDARAERFVVSAEHSTP